MFFILAFIWNLGGKDPFDFFFPFAPHCDLSKTPEGSEASPVSVSGFVLQPLSSSRNETQQLLQEVTTSPNPQGPFSFQLKEQTPMRSNPFT